MGQTYINTLIKGKSQKEKGKNEKSQLKVQK